MVVLGAERMVLYGVSRGFGLLKDLQIMCGVGINFCTNINHLGLGHYPKFYSILL